MIKVSTVGLQIAERARKFSGESLHNLHHFIDLPMLVESYKHLNKQSAKGVDGLTWHDYGEGLNERLENLLQGFKSGRKVSFKKMHYIIDADIKNYFGSINHGFLREFLDKRVKDGVVRRMIDKWLKAGILELGNISYPDEGTPQGGIILPILSNIYLHYVLDEWFSGQIQPLLKGRSFIIRYADDFIMRFSEKSDAQRVMSLTEKVRQIRPDITP